MYIYIYTRVLGVVLNNISVRADGQEGAAVKAHPLVRGDVAPVRGDLGGRGG